MSRRGVAGDRAHLKEGVKTLLELHALLTHAVGQPAPGLAPVKQGSTSRDGPSAPPRSGYYAGRLVRSPSAEMIGDLAAAWTVSSGRFVDAH